jgi:hypothetical protein
MLSTEQQQWKADPAQLKSKEMLIENNNLENNTVHVVLA